jgi:hypothetical protein
MKNLAWSMLGNHSLSVPGSGQIDVDAAWCDHLRAGSFQQGDHTAAQKTRAPGHHNAPAGPKRHFSAHSGGSENAGRHVS